MAVILLSLHAKCFAFCADIFFRASWTEACTRHHCTNFHTLGLTDCEYPRYSRSLFHVCFFRSLEQNVWEEKSLDKTAMNARASCITVRSWAGNLKIAKYLFLRILGTESSVLESLEKNLLNREKLCREIKCVALAVIRKVYCLGNLI